MCVWSFWDRCHTFLWDEGCLEAIEMLVAAAGGAAAAAAAVAAFWQ